MKVSSTLLPFGRFFQTKQTDQDPLFAGPPSIDELLHIRHMSPLPFLDMGEDEPEPSDPSELPPHRWAAALPHPSSPVVIHGRSGLLSSHIPVAFQPPNASFWERCSVRYLDRSMLSARREQAASAPGCPEWGRPVLRKVMQVTRSITRTDQSSG